jgi:hypothetical protein
MLNSSSDVTALPGRLQNAVREQQEAAEILIAWIQLAIKRSRRASLWPHRLTAVYRAICAITRRLVEFSPACERAALPGYALESSAGSLEGTSHEILRSADHDPGSLVYWHRRI